jgi:hypothetical protein
MRAILAVLAVLTAAVPAPSWNAAGHRIIASLAYDHLTPTARARVDDLIRRHPDYPTLFLRNAPADPAERARAAFLAASEWPDVIRTDARFYDDAQPGARPTPRLPGFPDMARHTNWHYINLPFTQDGTPGPAALRPNAVTELNRLIPILGRPPSDPANPVYALPWFLHLAGDLHNPVHAVARFSRELPQGDRGGNLVFVRPGSTLHGFWDGLLGSDPGLDAVVRSVRTLEGEGVTKETASDLMASPERWAREGFQLARSVVYGLGSGAGSQEKPINLSMAYRERAGEAARRRAVEAGLRIAAILNRELR